jgi:hypothetical protein
MPQSLVTALELNSKLIKTEHLENKKVIIDNTETPLKIKNNKGDIVFWVDENGASVKQIETKYNFTDLLDTPSVIEDGIMLVENEKILFKNDLKANSLKVKNLQSDEITTKKLNLDNINNNNIVTKSLLADKITCDDLSVISLLLKNLILDDIEAKKINSNDIKSDNLSSKKIHANNIIADDLNTNSLKCELSNHNKLSSKLVNSEKSVVKEFDCDKAKIDNLDVNNLNIDELKLKKIIVDDIDILNNKLHEYGSLNEPLLLALTQINKLKLEDGNNHKIYIKIIEKIVTQSFNIENLPKNTKLSWELHGDNIVNTSLNHNNNTSRININFSKKADANNILVLYIYA